MSPDFSDDPDTVPYAEFENPQTLNLYNYGRNNPLTNNDPDGHDVQICTPYGAGGQDCKTISNDQYAAGQYGNVGLKVPTLDQVGMNGNGSGQFNATNITNTGGNVVGTATYVPDNEATDYYANRIGYGVVSTASRGVTQVTAVAGAVYGAAGGAAIAPAIGASTLTSLGVIRSGLQAGAVVGGYILSQHAVDDAVERGVSLEEITEAVEGVAKGNPNNSWDSVQRFYTATCEVRVNRVTGVIVSVINKIRR